MKYSEGNSFVIEGDDKQRFRIKYTSDGSNIVSKVYRLDEQEVEVGNKLVIPLTEVPGLTDDGEKFEDKLVELHGFTLTK